MIDRRRLREGDLLTVAQAPRLPPGEASAILSASSETRARADSDDLLMCGSQKRTRERRKQHGGPKARR